VRVVLAVVGVAIAGLGIGYLGATRVLFPAPAPPGDMVEVPDVRGLTIDEAVRGFDEAGLELGDLEEMRHPAIDSGRIVGQAPLPGQLARPGASARLTVSLGPERRNVPEVTGLRADRALGVLEASGLQVRVDSVEHPSPRGRIVGVEPAEGTALTLPGEVAVTVSLGPPNVEMPSLLRLPVEAARDSLAVLGLEVGEVDEVFRFGRDQGRVVGQEPPAGTVLERGATVTLQIGRRGG
jgi:serine/threonine-protein kinase